ncbi:MAG: hypothetical protein WEB60_07645 [Terrimicrobiaceae bacterium]
MSHSVSDGYGLLGCSFLVLAVVGLWLRPFVKSVVARLGILGGILVISWIPIPGISLVVFLRGVMGDVSVPTFLLCGLMVWRCLDPSGGKGSASQKKPPFSAPNPSLHWFFLIVVIVGCLFYPMTMGFTLADPYSWGFAPHGMILVCLGLVLVLDFSGQRSAATLILLAIAAYAVGIMETSNLWDYLMDPLLFGISVVMTCRFMARARSVL